MMARGNHPVGRPDRSPQADRALIMVAALDNVLELLVRSVGVNDYGSREASKSARLKKPSSIDFCRYYSGIQEP